MIQTAIPHFLQGVMAALNDERAPKDHIDDLLDYKVACASARRTRPRD
jgi:hypothetical protein